MGQNKKGIKFVLIDSLLDIIDDQINEGKLQNKISEKIEIERVQLDEFTNSF